MSNNFVLQRRKRVEFELEIWQDNSQRTKLLGHRVKFQKNNIPGRVLPIQNNQYFASRLAVVACVFRMASKFRILEHVTYLSR